MRGHRVRLCCLLLSVSVTASGCCTTADKASTRGVDVVAGFGIADIGVLQSEHHTSPVGMVELRGPRVWRALRPLVGAQLDGERSSLTYAGAGYDIALGRRFWCTPSFAVGIFDSGTSKSGGSDHQFRSAVEFAYECRDGQRLGLLVQHVSNGGVAKPNPGFESILLTYSIPVR